VAEVTLAADAEYMEVTGLDINAHGGLYLIKYFIRNLATATNDFRLFFEADLVETNYYTQYMYADGTAVGGSRLNNPIILRIGATDSERGCFYVTRNYEGYLKASIFQPVFRGASIGMRFQVLITVGTKANLTSIRIKSGIAGANIGAGSKLEVYRFL